MLLKDAGTVRRKHGLPGMEEKGRKLLRLPAQYPVLPSWYGGTGLYFVKVMCFCYRQDWGFPSGVSRPPPAAAGHAGSS